MTFAKTFIDFYDVEVINGVHMGVSMEPTNVTGSGPYDCGAPGSKYPTSSKFGACNWKLTPPSNDYNWVSAGGSACNLDSECSSGTTCGISFNPGHANLLMKTCGTHIGYWTADQICGISPSYGAPFNCSAYWPLYACVGVPSCYQQGAPSSCCGCADWWEEGIEVPPTPDTEVCKSKNPTWTSNVQSTLKWLKSACPSAYTYPYDDMSSTFTCKNMVNDVNSVNYKITFCPENEVRSGETLFVQ